LSHPTPSPHAIRSSSSLAPLLIPLTPVRLLRYDLDGSGAIDHDEVKELVLTVFGKQDVDKNTEAMLLRMDEDHSGSVSLAEFRHMEKKAQTILSPCYIVQNAMIRKTGQKYWERQKKRRMKWAMDNNGGEDMNIAIFHRQLYDIPERDEALRHRADREKRRMGKQRMSADKEKIRHHGKNHRPNKGQPVPHHGKLHAHTNGNNQPRSRPQGKHHHPNHG
jgi:hypothetical protein